jgi:membrane-associated phospholipid phosphatase
MTKLPCLLFILLLQEGGTYGFAQGCPPEPPGEGFITASEWDGDSPMAGKRSIAWHSSITNLPGDWARSVQWTFNTKRLPTIAGLALLTGGLLATDHETRRISHGWYVRSRDVESATDFFVMMGDGRYQLGLAASFAAFGFVADDARALRTASQTAEAVLATGVVVQAFKYLTGRESPAVSTERGGVWRPCPSPREYHRNPPKYYAFPSGHIATAAATVTVIGENYPEVTWVKPAGYTLVGLIGISLVNNGFHWYSDLPLGVAIGYTFGMIAAHPEGFTVRDQVDQDVSFTIAPIMNASRTGLQCTISF